jgi:hypothetical protein
VTLLSAAVVAAFGLFLIGLAGTIVGAPARAERFLRAFAGSAAAHHAEQGLRLLVGTAIVHVAGAMRYPELFRVFGWVIVITTVGLLLIPWQWHQKFATRVMPPVYQHLVWFALGAAALGAFVLYSVAQVFSTGP